MKAAQIYLVFWNPSNVDPADGALEELERVIGQIRSRWSFVRILVRGDSAYSREEIMKWCESQVGGTLNLCKSGQPYFERSVGVDE